MTWHFNFRYYSDVTRGGIRNYFFNLFLSVITAISYSIVHRFVTCRGGGMTNYGLIAVGTDFGKLRILFDFDAPALIFGKVPVKGIELVVRHQVDVFLNGFYRKHVPSYIKVQTTVAEPWVVGDGNGRHCIVGCEQL